MTDLRQNFAPADMSRVNLNADLEVRYWCRHFSVTPDRLRDAVEKVGGATRDVGKELEQSY